MMMMSWKENIGKFYRFVVEEGNGLSIYTAKVISVSGQFLEIRDKFDKVLFINTDKIVKYEEVK